MLSPTVCRYEHFLTDWYEKWARTLGYPTDVADSRLSYRKIWEFAAILETLESNGLMRAGKSGLGFAVGREPITALLAASGVSVLATDLSVDESSDAWTTTGQHASGLEALYHPHLVDEHAFYRNAAFRPADMTDLSTLDGQYDFLWSSCAFEHLGTLERGLDFVVNAMRLLKPGGLAVHTTEFNISSNDDTIAEGNDCIYRRRDFELLDKRLRKLRCGLDPVDYCPGTHPNDLNFDAAPFFQPGSVHIKLEIYGFICTSILIVARKG